MVRIKILSNFDTSLGKKLLARYQEKYWEERVLFVRRWRIYLLFRVVFPFLLFALLLIPIILFSLNMHRYDLVMELFARLVIVIFGALCLWLVVKMIAGLINFYMDYTIVTPRQIISYDQEWIFHRNSRSIEIVKIKSISVDKKWFLKSLFNYGGIVFFAEGDSLYGDLILTFIYDPLLLRDRIAKIMKGGVV